MNWWDINPDDMKDKKETIALLRELEAKRDELDNFLRSAKMDEHYFKVLRDKNSLVCKIVAIKNGLDRLNTQSNAGISTYKLPYGTTFNN